VSKLKTALSLIDFLPFGKIYVKLNQILIRHLAD